MWYPKRGGGGAAAALVDIWGGRDGRRGAGRGRGEGVVGGPGGPAGRGGGQRAAVRGRSAPALLSSPLSSSPLLSSATGAATDSLDRRCNGLLGQARQRAPQPALLQALQYQAAGIAAAAAIAYSRCCNSARRRQKLPRGNGRPPPLAVLPPLLPCLPCRPCLSCLHCLPCLLCLSCPGPVLPHGLRAAGSYADSEAAMRMRLKTAVPGFSAAFKALPPRRSDASSRPCGPSPGFHPPDLELRESAELALGGARTRDLAVLLHAPYAHRRFAIRADGGVAACA